MELALLVHHAYTNLFAMKYLLWFWGAVLLVVIAWRYNAVPLAAEWKGEKVKPGGANHEYARFRKTIDSLHKPAIAYARALHMNDSIALIADYSVHSGLKRMAVVQLKSGTILDTGLVAHGNGAIRFAEQPVFSNTPESHCSSLGRYRIGNAYPGRFGVSYKLHGLDKSNSNALARFVVLHPYDCVPDGTVYPDYLCNSQGCPMVSYAFLKRLSGYINVSQQPLLLWIVN